ncbi:hypothetical protein [Caballeronia sp. LZ043]|uniref:hypothetical protein n=1 Tax=Caballeronia sp. LZ043 TaxID=3038569 RepID=UPI00285540AF|nr:hypothetical protein [Caballeronia sp. LZ043]MDR5819313.1 hypothetical protein [Caballeronia sp. LZ043]
MPNVVEYIEPFSTSVPLDFRLTAGPFRAQFCAVTTPGTATPVTSKLPDPATLHGYIALLAAALDSGYGANAAPMPAMPVEDRVSLYQHLWRQLDLALSLIKSGTGGISVLQPFAPELEKSAKSALSYLLGTLYARVATGLWGQENRWGKVGAFWHYGVLSSHAVNFKVTSASKALNPDFLVRFDGRVSHWACIETKGSLGDQNNEVLKSGLYQAGKLKKLQWLDAGSLTTVNAVPAEQACVMTYFAPPDNTLEVLLMDPPAGEVEATPSDFDAPLLFKEAGDFLCWTQALEQFDGIASLSDEIEFGMSGSRFDWAPVPGRKDIWVGVSILMRQNHERLTWAISLLEWLVPVLSRWRDRPDVKPRTINRRLSDMVRYASERANPGNRIDVDGSVEMWAALASRLKEMKRGNKEFVSWLTLLENVWSCKLFSAGSERIETNQKVQSLGDLWSAVDSAVRIEGSYFELSNVIDWETMTTLPFEHTAYGLIIVGFAPDQ